jgi:hypothetical protein
MAERLSWLEPENRLPNQTNLISFIVVCVERHFCKIEITPQSDGATQNNSMEANIFDENDELEGAAERFPFANP